MNSPQEHPTLQKIVSANEIWVQQKIIMTYWGPRAYQTYWAASKENFWKQYCIVIFVFRQEEFRFFNIFHLLIGETELKEVKANDDQTPLQKGSELKEFSPGVIKDWSDINIKKEIGEGNFGKVYKGYLHLNEVQR